MTFFVPCTVLSLKTGDLRQMRVILDNIFAASKLSDMQVTPAQCGWVHIYELQTFFEFQKRFGNNHLICLNKIGFYNSLRLDFETFSTTYYDYYWTLRWY